MHIYDKADQPVAEENRMPTPTQIITKRIDGLFKEYDHRIDTAVRKKDHQEILAILEEYMQNFPTPGDYVYEYLFLKDADLNSRYTDYTLKERKEGQTDSVRVETCRQEYREKKAPGEKEMPDDFPVYFYNEKVIKKAISRKKLSQTYLSNPEISSFADNWRDKLSVQGYRFMQSSTASATVRNVMFHLAFALDMDVKVLRSILKKCLLQMDINPKDPKESVYWYCLENGIPYADMLSQYLDYIYTDDFCQKYVVRWIPSEERNPYTVYWTAKLESMVKKDRDAFLHYLWLIQYSDVTGTARSIRETYWLNFLCFPKTVWMGNTGKSRQTITTEQIRQAKLVAETEENSSLFQEDRQFESVNQIFDTFVASGLSEASKGNRAAKDFLKTLVDKETEEDAQEKNLEIVQAERVLTKEEYEILLPMILKTSRGNYAAANTEQLLPPQTLKKIFGKLEYSSGIVHDRRKGKVTVSRMELIATKFIGFFSDYSAIFPKAIRTHRSRMDNFEKLVNDDMEACGMHAFYLRSPFDLFLAMCFLREDPLAYFMASWEAALQEP